MKYGKEGCRERRDGLMGGKNVPAKVIKAAYLKADGSFTVETSLIMPMILICIIIIIFMNGCLHDMVTISSVSVESGLARDEMTDAERDQLISQRTMFMHQAAFSRKNGWFYENLSWKASYNFPFQGLINMLLRDSVMTFSGKSSHMKNNMTVIMRYLYPDKKESEE